MKSTVLEKLVGTAFFIASLGAVYFITSLVVLLYKMQSLVEQGVCL